MLAPPSFHLSTTENGFRSPLLLLLLRLLLSLLLSLNLLLNLLNLCRGA